MADIAVNDFVLRRYSVAIILLALVLNFSITYAQISTSIPSNYMENKNPVNAEKQSLTASVSTSVSGSRSLEEPVDPDKYILGPGDVLGIALRGAIDSFFEEKVTPEGNLLIPFSKVIKVSGLSLTEAIDEIHVHWDGNFPNTEIDVTLLEIRTFRVLITGAVVQPGYYELTPADRAISAILLAQGLYDEIYWRTFYKDEMNANKWNYEDLKREYKLAISSKRNCRLIRSDNHVINLDLLKYERGIIGDNNPFLKEGDKIIVGYKSEQTPEIEISGAVSLPGKYEWRKGDTVKDLLEISGGLLPEAKFDSVLYAGVNSDGSLHKMELNLISTDNPDYNEELGPDDLILVRFVSEKYNRISVRVDGEVKYPGIYPAIEGISRISDIIEMAGGFNENAYLEGATVSRKRRTGSNLDNELQRLRDFNELTSMNIEDQFYKFSERWRSLEKVGVDFVALYEEGDASYDQLVEDDDFIQIPNRENNVLVMGMVVKPGLYPYIEGWNYMDYIKEAGGYVSNARPGIVRLVSYESSVWQKPNTSSIVGPGDLIFVPEAPDRFGWTTFKDIFTVASQAATVLVVILNLK